MLDGNRQTLSEAETAVVEKPKEEVKGDMEEENVSRPKIASAIEGFTGWGFRVWVFGLLGLPGSSSPNVMSSSDVLHCNQPADFQGSAD